MRKQKILIYVDSILAEDVISILDDENITIATSNDIEDAMDEAYAIKANTVILFDKHQGASDGRYIASAKSLNEDKIRIILVSSRKTRQIPSDFFARMYEAGCKEIICTSGKPMEWMNELAKCIYKPIKEEDVIKLCNFSDKKNEEVLDNESNDEVLLIGPSKEQIVEAARLHDAGDISDEIFSSVQTMTSDEIARIIEMAQRTEKIRLDADENLKQAYEGMKQNSPSRIGRVEFVNVAQVQPREGSTHMCFSLAKTLAMLGKKVAVVIPEYHLYQLKQNFSNCPYDDERQWIRISKIDFYVGETPTAAPDGYEIIICDFGCAKWLVPQKGKQEVEAKKIKDNFYNANIKILTSFVSPTGDWSARFKVIRNMSIKDLNRTTFAVFGMQSKEMYEAYKRDISSEHGDVKTVNIGYMPGPLTCNSLNKIDEGIKKIVAKILPSKELFKLTSQKEKDDVASNKEVKQQEKGIFAKLRGLNK